MTGLASYTQEPDHLSHPLRALWWLTQDGLRQGPGWEKAHALCQEREGDPDHDVVHALVHWIEGDEANARYWYRRARGPRATTIAAEWQRIARLLGAEA